jgi:hypothetical protein
MPTTVKVTSIRPASQAAFIEAVKRQARPALRRKAVVLGESMVREAVKVIDDNLQLGSPDHRKPGPHLRNSLTYKIKDEADGVNVTLTIKPGVSAKKVAAINYGTEKPYVITPTGVVAGQGGLSRPRSSVTPALIRTGISIRPTQWLRWPDPAGGKDVFRKIVFRKPFEGVHFLERGRAAAIAKFEARRV